MAEPRGVSTGVNSRPLNDTVAETGPGIPDDAVLDGELAPGELEQDTKDGVDKLERAGWSKPDAAGSVGGG